MARKHAETMASSPSSQPDWLSWDGDGVPVCFPGAVCNLCLSQFTLLFSYDCDANGAPSSASSHKGLFGGSS